MQSLGAFVSSSNSSADLELYIFSSTVTKINAINDKVILVVYAIVLFLSIMQTLWKNKWIDHLLARMNAAYSDGKFQTSQVCFRQLILID